MAHPDERADAGDDREPSGAYGEVARLRTLLDITNAIVTVRDRDELYRTLVRTLRQALLCDMAGLAVFDAEADTLRVVVFEGAPPGAAVVGQLLPLAHRAGGPPLDIRQPLLRTDLANEWEYEFEQVGLALGVQSAYHVPIIFRGALVGGIAVGSRVRGAYGAADVEFLGRVAQQLGLAIANVEALNEVEQLRARAQQVARHRRLLLDINNALVTHLTQADLFAAATVAIGRVMDFDSIAIMLYDESRDEFRILGIDGVLSDAFAPGVVIDHRDPRSGVSAELRQPFIRRDLAVERQFVTEDALYAEGHRSMCLVPLMARGQFVGTLGVGSKTPAQYSEADAEMLQDCATQVALAVINMRAYEEIAELKRQLQAENIYLQEEIRAEHDFNEIVGSSGALRRTLRAVDRVAATDATVLVLGETGTGKELIARALHDRSPRKQRPLVKVNCAAISAGLMESELFGHVKGAFTGALSDRQGRFQLADGGTMFLDEVGELPLDLQAKLLRVLQEREFEPVGSSRTVHVDVRVIAATNRDLNEAVRNGQFRADLLYRLNVFDVRVPPLRERAADVPVLVAFFLRKYATKLGRPVRTISDDTMQRLRAYSWPGNVRELEHVIERAVIVARGETLEVGAELLSAATVPLSPATQAPAEAAPAARSVPPSPASVTLTDVEREHIVAVLARTQWKIEGPAGAARILNLQPSTLRSRMQKLGIRRPSEKGC